MTTTIDNLIRGAITRRQFGRDARVEVHATITFQPIASDNEVTRTESVRLWVRSEDLERLVAHTRQTVIGPCRANLARLNPERSHDGTTTQSLLEGQAIISLDLGDEEQRRHYVPGWGIRSNLLVVCGER